jgi:glycosyltransferase involved in cell wall biosynthesis
MIRVLGLAFYGSLAASHRVRLGQYQLGLRDFGIDLQIQSLLGNNYLQSRFQNKRLPLGSLLSAGVERLNLLLRKSSFDVAIVHCELFPLLPGWLEQVLLRLPYIYDFDDAFYLRYRNGYPALLNSILGEKFNSVIRGATAITAGNTHLANYAKALNSELTILPSVVNTDHFCPLKKKVNEKFTVGWVGSPSTAPYLQRLAAPLSRLGETVPLRLVVVGGEAPKVDNVEVIEIPWSEDSEVALINTFDVGVMPLPDDEWARGKCAFKLIQYMACGVPVVASPVGANIDLVTPEVGFLAESDEDWMTSLLHLYKNPSARHQLGTFARQRIIESYSLNRNLPVLAGVINKVSQKG